ncbi:MAG: TRAP transporter small permease [Rhizobiales bacterium]|nr:TRAP transporter small permease [Hyphomicrobiales bacterium]
MKHGFIKLYQTSGKWMEYAAAIAGFLAFLMMWVIDTNAISRKLFNAPVPAGVEFTQSILTAVIMLPFAYTLYKQEHVNTVFLTSRFSPEFNRWLHCFWMTVGMLIFAAVAYASLQYTIRSYNMNEQVWGATIRFAVYPAKAAVAIGAALISFQFLMEALHAIIIGGSPLSEAAADHYKVH